LNNYRRALHALFAFGVSEGNCVANPVSKIPLFAVPDRAPAILTVEEAERLVGMAAVTNDTLGLLGFVTLGLFAGLRRSEIERLDWSAVKRERRMVTIDGSIAKSGSIRNVPLSENALAWLSLCGSVSGRVAPRNINPKLRRLRFLAAIERWEGNELRHSCASYFYDYTQDAARTAAQLGHASGTQLLFEHYRALVPLGAGERFFAIRPPENATLDGDLECLTVPNNRA
jgi:integrase